MNRAKKPRLEVPGWQDDPPIWEFIYDTICNLELHDEVTEELFRQYLIENKSVKWTSKQLFDHYNTHMRKTLYKTDLSGRKQLQLFVALKIEISDHVEWILEKRFGAVLRIDPGTRILESFSIFNDSSPEKPAESPPKLTRKVPEARKESPERAEIRRSQPQILPLNLEINEAEMWEHISRYPYTIPSTHILTHQFWEEMVETSPSAEIRSAHLILDHFQKNMLTKVWRQDLDYRVRLNLLKYQKIPLSDQQKRYFLEKDQVAVELSPEGHVISWEKIGRRDEYVSHDSGTHNVEWTPPKRNIATWMPRMSSKSSSGPSTSSAPPPPPQNISRRNSSPELEVTVVVPRRTSPRRSITPPPRPDTRMEARTETRASSTIRYPSTTGGAARRVPFTTEDQINAWRYIYQTMKKAITLKMVPVLPKGLVFWTEYVRKSRSAKTPSNWSSHFRKQMCPTLHEMRFSRDTILFLFKNIDIEVNHDVHEILERKCNARIRLSHNRNVVSWRYLDEPENTGEEDSEDQEEEEEESIASTLPLETDEAMIQEEEEPQEEPVAHSTFQREPRRPMKTESPVVQQPTTPRRSLRNAAAERTPEQSRSPRKSRGGVKVEAPGSTPGSASRAAPEVEAPEAEALGSTSAAAPGSARKSAPRDAPEAAPQAEAPGSTSEGAPEAEFPGSAQRSAPEAAPQQEAPGSPTKNKGTRRSRRSLGKQAPEAAIPPESVEKVPEDAPGGAPGEAPGASGPSGEAPESSAKNKSPRRSRRSLGKQASEVTTSSEAVEEEAPEDPSEKSETPQKATDPPESASKQKASRKRWKISDEYPESQDVFHVESSSTPGPSGSTPHFTFQPPVPIADGLTQATEEDAARRQHKYFDLTMVDGTNGITPIDYLTAIQKTLDSCGDEAIDMMGEAVKAAMEVEEFTEEQQDEIMEDCRRSVNEMLQDSRLSRHNQRDLLSNAEELIEIVVGNMENRHQIENRKDQFRVLVQEKIRELMEQDRRAAGEEEEEEEEEEEQS
uniref:SPK domain-containing protein n=1 Tax=Caenorhabditis tropicalis TaxID=1561998 RepID=A0A1I7U7N7_9PELO